MAGSIVSLLYNSPVIPAVRTPDDFKFALTQTTAPSIILLFGDINMLPDLLAQAKQYHKRLVLHLDLFEGVGKDKAGIQFLARLGVSAVITTKAQLAKIAREQGMIVVQRLFIMDSEAVRTGIHLLSNFKPDALEILPASVPGRVVQKLIRETGLPILAGGLIEGTEDVAEALQKGICAVSTNKRELWKLRF
ncbi:glycerol-3-phosphate responsive antiterminator [Thermosinus carboxydivorans Nor1]|uniref:Glycerol-3-phosphate responsive antiterminator n=1 Tax=Thermosinus carboxydivorans Nor1 TaxID=401526 RepID=A1HRW1_9FIRM|nr:glycerol-3-phosphate responsive antiterminator [Thermosinus carboxydivorans]EAX47282.1 glycerol-3-phosphate responsive antiterminator [Thermosinus carboxydivorans Nor1]